MNGLTGHFRKYLTLLVCTLLLNVCTACGIEQAFTEEAPEESVSVTQVELGEIPEYQGSPYIEVEENEPDFTEEELTAVSYESYGELDGLGRCTTVEACIGTDLMPKEERGNISEVKPTGWQSVQYDNVEGGSLYNRCHLIGYQLTGENANEQNLITGTRYMNTEGMLPFENEVAEYVEETDYHVMYRVTPVFEGDNLVASGVWMEAESVEDGGEGVSFNVYVYNVQPGIEIDYTQGNSSEADDARSGSSGDEDVQADSGEETQTYILNTNTHKFHKPDCSSVGDMKPQNRQEFEGTRGEAISQGYDPCGSCNP